MTQMQKFGLYGLAAATAVALWAGVPSQTVLLIGSPSRWC